MLHPRARATSRRTNDEIEAKAKALCADDGLAPGQNVMHAYGDEFTVQEWEYRWTSNTAISAQPVVGPMWRLYRARAVVERRACRRWSSTVATSSRSGGVMVSSDGLDFVPPPASSRSGDLVAAFSTDPVVCDRACCVPTRL